MLKKRRSLEEPPVERRESSAEDVASVAEGQVAAGGEAAAEDAASAAEGRSIAEGAASSAETESAAGAAASATEDGSAAEGAASATGDAAAAADPTVSALQSLQYRAGYAEARLELAEQAAITLQTELDRVLEDLKRERKRAETERERVEEFRYIVHRLQGQEFEARQKAERREWERDRAREEARRLRDELEAERGRGLRRVVIAVLLVIFVVAAVAIMAGTLYTGWV